jgi:hopanoid biosynthesis associated RND transporter like protein HpnN
MVGKRKSRSEKATSKEGGKRQAWQIGPTVFRPPGDRDQESAPAGGQSRPVQKTNALTAAMVQTVDICTRHRWLVVAFALLVTALSAAYAARHFAMDTDTSKLISADLPWRERELAYSQAFPHRNGTILIVIDASTPELAQEAADRLSQRLLAQPGLFPSVRQPGSGAFFEQNGLLFQGTEAVARITGQLTAATPLLGTLAADPSFRGVTDGLAIGIGGVQGGQMNLNDLARPMNMLSDTLEDGLAGRPASFSWRVLMSGQPAPRSELRRFIEVQPVLDFNALEPGKAASTAIRQAATDLRLAEDLRARVRLTGEVAIQDEEFGTLKEGAVLNHSLTVLAVLILLWLALHSAKIIVAVFLALFAGLVMTAALGLMMVGALNPISIAFAVLFIGIGVDFGLQFSVRYRAERHDIDEMRAALRNSAVKAGGPLALAAATTAAGFLSFLPTDYKGLSELGLIAGVGMIIAFITSITLLPALLYIFNPPGERHAVGYSALAPVDRFLERYRIPVIVGTIGIVLLGSPLLADLRFDSNPINLRSPKVESISTLLDLRDNPMTSGSSIELLAPSLGRADAIADRLMQLPEVASTMTLASFVPDGQQEKLGMIQRAAGALGPVLTPQQTKPAPTDVENVRAAGTMAGRLQQVAGNGNGPGAAAAKRLSGLLSQFATASEAARTRLEQAIVLPLRIALGGLRTSLQAQPVTLETLPNDLIADWRTADGRARVSVAPKGDPADNDIIRNFAEAVLAVEPTATGAPVSILEAGRTIVGAFIEAGAWALLAIAVLLWIALRRFSDVLLTLVPLILAGVVTLELCVLIGLPLNFANIIALPLLLGVGVAYKIYYIMAWRAGKTNLLQSTLTRAVIFSALTTATAFGSLWFSNHPGTSSMGQLLALSLACTMAAAVLFQPVLMGPPREEAKPA